MDWGKVFANDATNKNLTSKTTKNRRHQQIILQKDMQMVNINANYQGNDAHHC